jgi:hypothetical protein
VLTKQTFAMIKALHERGVYQQDIAQQVGVHPKTVSRALARGKVPSGERTKPGSKLDAYKATVDRLLGEGVWNAVVIHREIQAEGYTGGITMLRMYIVPKRSLRPTRATVHFETAPGRQMQSDWGEIETNTRNPVLRFVYLGIALLLVNLWCLLRFRYCQIPPRGSAGRPIDPRRFKLRQLALFLRLAIERLHGVTDLIHAHFLPLQAESVVHCVYSPAYGRAVVLFDN